MGVKLLALEGSFPGFSSIATILAGLHNFGIVLVLKQLLNMSSNHQRADSPKCLSCSQRMSSSQAALMQNRSSLVAKGLVKLVILVIFSRLWKFNSVGTMT